MQAQVRMQRVTPVTTGAEKHRLPEVTHGRQVGIEVHPGDVDEQRAEKVIPEREGIEIGQQRPEIVATGDVVTARRKLGRRAGKVDQVGHEGQPAAGDR